MERSIISSFPSYLIFNCYAAILPIANVAPCLRSFPVNATESDKSEVWWKNLRQWNSWNHTLMSSDSWDMLWNLLCSIRLYGSHLTLRHIAYEADLITNGLLLSFWLVFLGLKVSRKWSNHLLQNLGALAESLLVSMEYVSFEWVSLVLS